jgi:hypothetical protein
VVGLIVGFLRRPAARRGKAAPLLMIGLAIIIPTLVAVFVFFPPRIKTVFVPVLAVSLALMAHALIGHWRPRRQLALALALVALGYAALPVVAGATRFHRTESEVSAFLRIRCQPETRSVLVCHDMQELSFPLHRVFGPGRVIDGEADIEETFSGEPLVRVELDRGWKRKALEWFYPELRQAPVRPGEVEVLVFLINEEHWARRPRLPHRHPTAWSHPALSEIRARLPHRSEYQHDDFTIVIFEAGTSGSLRSGGRGSPERAWREPPLRASLVRPRARENAYFRRLFVDSCVGRPGVSTRRPWLASPRQARNFDVQGPPARHFIRIRHVDAAHSPPVSRGVGGGSGLRRLVDLHGWHPPDRDRRRG